MTLDAIRKSILNEAESKASSTESEAEKEAHRIVKEAEEKAKEIVKTAEAEAHKEVERLKKEAEAGADTEANGLLLEARGAVVERSLKKAIDETKSELSESSFEKIFKQGLKQFAEIAGNSDIMIKTSKKNAEIVKGSKHKVEYENIDGFMFYTHDNKIALNATIESIAARETDQARTFIASELFGTRAKERPKAAVKAGKKKVKKNKKKG